jgi:cytochrome P450
VTRDHEQQADRRGEQAVMRRAARAANMDAVRFAPGDLIVRLIGAANRDPDQFPESDAFDLTRAKSRRLGFASTMRPAAAR